MLEWLKELFSPVLRVESSGTYVASQPNINDVSFAGNVRYTNQINIYAGGSQTWSWRVLTAYSHPLKIKSFTCEQTAGANDYIGYGISNGLVLQNPATWDEIELNTPAVVGTRAVSLLPSNKDVVLPIGYSLYLITYDAGSGARTYMSWISYNELTR